jgi:hypothetical protein
MKRQRCPFRGCIKQTMTPCEVQAEQPDGSHKAEVWHAILCSCGTGARPARTPRQAWDNWNRRA